MHTKERTKNNTNIKTDVQDKTGLRSSFQHEKTLETGTRSERISEKHKKKNKINILTKKVAKGSKGEQNIKIQSFYVPVGPHISAYDVVKTCNENRLQVFVKQEHYKKEYEAVGSIKTKTLPVASVGVKGSILAKDLDTGETLEFCWQWKSLNGLNNFWQKIKDFLLK